MAKKLSQKQKDARDFKLTAAEWKKLKDDATARKDGRTGRFEKMISKISSKPQKTDEQRRRDKNLMARISRLKGNTLQLQHDIDSTTRGHPLFNINEYGDLADVIKTPKKQNRKTKTSQKSKANSKIFMVDGKPAHFTNVHSSK